MPNIYHDFTIEATPAQVFKAISLPEELEHWWPQQCSGKPEVGAHYRFYFGPEYDWQGRVSHSVENKAFYMEMTKADADWSFTSFGFDLLPVSIGTQVQFWHKNWLASNHAYRKAAFCWALLLNGLKKYAETGEIIPFEQRS